MRVSRQIVSLCLVFSLSALLAPVTFASGTQFEHFVLHEHYAIDNVIFLANPCTGGFTTATTQGQGHVNVVSDGAGGGHVIIVESETGEAVDEDGTTYVVGVTTLGSGQATFVQGNMAVTVESNVHFVSPGGAENYIAHGLIHMLITPNGTTRDFELFSTECRG